MTGQKKDRKKQGVLPKLRSELQRAKKSAAEVAAAAGGLIKLRLPGAAAESTAPASTDDG